MRKRQFGKQRKVIANDHNLTQDYTELSIKEIALDSNSLDIIDISGPVPDINPHYIVLISLIARDSTGERIPVLTSVGIDMQPSTSPGIGEEVWMTASASFVNITTSSGVDSEGHTYYRDYQNGYAINITDGAIASTGMAIRPTPPANSVIICDILYDQALASTGVITSSGIDTTRQVIRYHTHSNKTQLDLITDGAHDTRTDNPHLTTKSQIGLGNVTNDAQVKRRTSTTDGYIPTWASSTGDYLDVGYPIENTLTGSPSNLTTANAIKTYIDYLISISPLLIYKGTIDCSTNPNYPAANLGDVYKVSSSGMIGGVSGIIVEIGDMLVCFVDGSPSGDQATVGDNWDILQENTDGIVIGSTYSEDNELPIFVGTTGKLIGSSGYFAQDASTTQKGFVQLSNSYTTSSGILATTELALSQGIAQSLIKGPNDFGTFLQKFNTDYNDIILIEDSNDSFIKKKVQLGNLDTFQVSSSSGLLIYQGKIRINAGEGLGFETGVILLGALNVIVDNDTIYINSNNELAITSAGALPRVATSAGLYITSSGKMAVNINTSSGVLFTSSGEVAINLGSLDGSGLELIDGKLSLILSSGGGLGITSDGLYVMLGEGLTFGSVKASLGPGLGFSSTGNINVLTDNVTIKLSSSTGVTTNSWVTNASWNLNTARRSLGGAGTQSAALSFGGTTGSVSAVTEKFNGSAWSATGSLNTGRYTLAGSGTQSAALSFGGFISSSSAVTEKFNGSTWSNSGNLNTARYALSGCGIQSAALSFGGSNGYTTTEKFNGSTWSTNAGWNMNDSRYYHAGTGLQDSALAISGLLSTPLATSEKFNGSTWISTGNLNIARSGLGAAGIQNESSAFGGQSNSGLLNTTEKFNGTLWSIAESLNVARQYTVGMGTQSAALCSGGLDSIGYTGSTEKYLIPGSLFLKVVDGLYSSTGHTHTSSEIGLGNVTNDAQLKRAAGDFNTFTEITNTEDTDILLIEDYSDSYNKKKVQITNLIITSTGTDTDAIHLSSSGDINSLTEKTSLVSDDLFIIEDSADSNNKKSFKYGNFVITGGGDASAIYIPTTGDVGELSITSSGYKTITINSILNTLAFNPANVNTWVATGSLNTARYYLGGTGTHSAALSFGGDTNGSGNYVATTEKFNGSAWSTNAGWNLNTARYMLTGTGTQSAALSFGGFISTFDATTEKFNGSSWTASGSLNTARSLLARAGTQSAALSFGGNASGNSAVTEKFNGSTWAASGNLNTAREGLSGAGVQSAALSFGGYIAAASAITEKFNGSTWIATGTLNTARHYMAGCGTQNAALSMGGIISAVTEKFNGSTWAASGNMNTARYGLAGAGTQNQGLSFGGNTGSISAVTEKFTEPYKLKLQVLALENTTDNTATDRTEMETYESNLQFSIKCPAVISYGIICEREYDTYANKQTGVNAGLNILSYGYWITSGNLNTARTAPAGAGIQSLALSFGGTGPSAVTEKFDGSTWTTSGSWNLNTGRFSSGGCGSQSAALASGGNTGSASAVTEKFNGSAWSNSGSLNTARYYLFICGTQNSSLSFGGTSDSTDYLATVEEFNGSTWLSATNLNIGRYGLAGSGIQSAATIFSGLITGASFTTTTEKYNGSTWSNSSNMTVSRSYLAGAGFQNSTLGIGGLTPGVTYSPATEKFNGLAWTVTGFLNTARNSLFGVGNQASAVSFGGTTGSASAVTEKFNYNRDISELFTTEDCYVDKSIVQIGY